MWIYCHHHHNKKIQLRKRLIRKKHKERGKNHKGRMAGKTAEGLQRTWTRGKLPPRRWSFQTKQARRNRLYLNTSCRLHSRCSRGNSRSDRPPPHRPHKCAGNRESPEHTCCQLPKSRAGEKTFPGYNRKVNMDFWEKKKLWFGCNRCLEWTL